MCSPELRARPPDPTGRLREPEEDVLHLDGSELGVVDARDGLEGLVLGVVDDVLDAVDGGDGGAGLVEGLDDLIAGALGDPGPHRLVELVGVLGPLGALLEPGLVYVLGAPDEAHHALGDVLGAGGDGDPVAVFGLVGVARGVVDRAVAAALLDDAELVVDDGLRTEHGEDGLEDRQVHDLTAARGVAGPQRRQHGEGRGERRYAVGEAEGREGRRAVGLAGHVGEPAHRLGQRSEPGPVLVRPELPEARDAGEDETRVLSLPARS